ncbi:MAG TPA: DegQ family serine endoprotease [Terriglobia bacterium]|nr:DegQ family serine endoprotease [Terriglobia bacterium]
MNVISRRPLWPMCVVIAVAFAIGGAAGSTIEAYPTLAATVSETRPAPPIVTDDRSLPQTTFAPAVKKVMPSVVNISSLRKTTVDNRIELFADDPIFRRFFDERLGRQPLVPRERRDRSLGSGVLVSPDGYILTNEHVVDGAMDVKVALSDKREYSARIVGTDSKTDLAVLKIDQTGLPAITIGDSSKVQVGDVVLAVGNPFGVGQTVTMGIVSATGRGNLGIEDYEDFIQTDAAINPGNSGGALVDAEGRLIGINTAILSRSGGNQGVGFAIPANMARNVMDQIIQSGKVSRAFLGVTIQPVTSDLAKIFKLDKGGEGALISEVAPNSPAERAGLKSGDIVLRIDNDRVADSRGLQLMIGEMKPGRNVRLTVFRDGIERSYSVTLGEQPGERNGSSLAAPSGSSRKTLDGVAVEPLTQSMASRYGVAHSTKGLVVRRVDPGSAAAEAGLEPGDVILEVNRQTVTGVDELARQIEQSLTDSTLLLVSREGRTRYVVIPMK